MTSMPAQATVRRFVACINAHDARGIVELCTADHSFIDGLGTRVSDLRLVERGWEEYFALFPDYRIELETIASGGEIVLASGWASATHANSKAALRIPAAWRATVRHGRVAQWQVYADNKPIYELLARANTRATP